MQIQSKVTVDTVANAIALSTAVVQRVAGNEVANTLSGSPLTRAAIERLVAARINANFANRTQQGAQS